MQGVVERQVAIVVANVGPGTDLIYDGVLLVDADYMLNRLSLEVLLASSLKEFIAAGKPIEYVFVAITGALEKRILPKVIFFAKRLILIRLKYLEHLHILGLNGNRNGIVSLEVRLHTFLRSHIEQFLYQAMLT